MQPISFSLAVETITYGQHIPKPFVQSRKGQQRPLSVYNINILVILVSINNGSHREYSNPSDHFRLNGAVFPRAARQDVPVIHRAIEAFTREQEIDLGRLELVVLVLCLEHLVD